jgi:hypothetical protein
MSRSSPQESVVHLTAPLAACFAPSLRCWTWPLDRIDSCTWHRTRLHQRSFRLGLLPRTRPHQRSNLTPLVPPRWTPTHARTCAPPQHERLQTLHAGLDAHQRELQRLLHDVCTDTTSSTPRRATDSTDVYTHAMNTDTRRNARHEHYDRHTITARMNTRCVYS